MGKCKDTKTVLKNFPFHFSQQFHGRFTGSGSQYGGIARSPHLPQTWPKSKTLIPTAVGGGENLLRASSDRNSYFKFSSALKDFYLPGLALSCYPKCWTSCTLNLWKCNENQLFKLFRPSASSGASLPPSFMLWLKQEVENITAFLLYSTFNRWLLHICGFTSEISFSIIMIGKEMHVYYMTLLRAQP